MVQNGPVASEEKSFKEKFMMLDRQRTDAGRQVIAKAHMSFYSQVSLKPWPTVRQVKKAQSSEPLVLEWAHRIRTKM